MIDNRLKLRVARGLKNGWKIRLRGDRDGYSLVAPDGMVKAGGSLSHCWEMLYNLYQEII